MNCNEFRKQHCLFVDDTLPGIDIVRMQRHLNECTSCAEIDVKIRRSLLLVRNIRTIHPSAGFAEKLEAKLRECQAEKAFNNSPEARLTLSSIKQVGGMRYLGGFGAVASVVMLGYAALVYSKFGSPLAQKDIVMPGVIAVAQPPRLTTVSDFKTIEVGHDIDSEMAVLGSLSAGMPIIPMAMFAEQVSDLLARQGDHE